MRLRITQLGWSAWPAPCSGMMAPDWEKEYLTSSNPNNTVAIAKRFIDSSGTQRASSGQTTTRETLRGLVSGGRGNILRGLVGVKVIWSGWVRALVPFGFAQGRLCGA